MISVCLLLIFCSTYQLCSRCSRHLLAFPTHVVCVLIICALKILFLSDLKEKHLTISLRWGECWSTLSDRRRIRTGKTSDRYRIRTGYVQQTTDTRYFLPFSTQLQTTRTKRGKFAFSGAQFYSAIFPRCATEN